MSTADLILAIPSKGRLQEQTDDWLADCGFTLRRAGGARSYIGVLDAAPGVSVRLMSAREIAKGLDTGEIHLGVTGEDVIREESANPDENVKLITGLGFGRADLVVAVPQGWIDVSTMHDLEDVAARERARRGRQLRVATKYHALTRAFFLERGLVDYRIVDSHGATEGAPAAGVADVIVDITTTGSTLAANHLRPLTDGVILKSQAQLAASVRADWSPDQRARLAAFLDVVEARASGRERMLVRGAHAPQVWQDAAVRFGGEAAPDGFGLTCTSARAFEAAAFARDETGAGVTVQAVDYHFSTNGELFARAKAVFEASGL